MHLHVIRKVAFLAIILSAQLFVPCMTHARPRVALVLEGGGALGFAHVGVLKVLEEQRIPVDFVAGTSMGSIVGAAYATGCTVEEMEKTLSTTNWDELFNEAPPRRMVNYREKTGRRAEIYGDAKIGIKDGNLVVPNAIVQGQYVEPLLRDLFSKAPPSIDFDDLPIPFRAVAADIETGKAVVLERGNIALAARASMSVPGFFSPVEIDGRMLVDGGVINNFPVDLALERSPDVVIGVRLATTLRTRDDLDGPLAISAQILDMLLRRTTQDGLSLMRSGDMLVEPDVSMYTATSFQSAKEIMLAGEAAARSMISQLRALSVSAEEYSEYYRDRTGGTRYAPPIDSLRVEGLNPYYEAKVRQALQFEEGAPYDAGKVSSALNDIYKEGVLKKLHSDVEERNGSHTLVIRGEQKEWLDQYVRIGFALEDDFKGENGYSMGAEARINNLNSSGAHADIELEMGDVARLAAELYQPLYAGSSFFILPNFELSRRDLTVLRNGDKLAEYERRLGAVGIAGGVSFGPYGELTSGWRRGTADVNRVIGDPSLSGFDYDVGEWITYFELDQVDNVDFPTEGYRVFVSSLQSRDGLGASEQFEQLRATATIPLTYKSFTWLVNGEVGYSSDDLPVGRSYSLGGAFDISGYPMSSIVSDNYWVSRSVFFYRFAQGSSSLLTMGGYLGGSLEVASLRTNAQDIGDERGVVAGSVFVGADTPLLPIYLGFGMSDTQERSVFLNIGRISPRRR